MSVSRRSSARSGSAPVVLTSTRLTPLASAIVDCQQLPLVPQAGDHLALPLGCQLHLARLAPRAAVQARPHHSECVVSSQPPSGLAPLAPALTASSLFYHADSIEIRSFCWDTYGTMAPAPNDTGLVSVVDGGASFAIPPRPGPRLGATLADLPRLFVYKRRLC